VPAEVQPAGFVSSEVSTIEAAQELPK
jgi:hypothetical protein